MDWNTVTLKTFDPGPPKTSFLWKECGCVSPPLLLFPPLSSSLPRDCEKAGTVSLMLACSALCCRELDFHMYTVFHTCAEHVVTGGSYSYGLAANECLMLIE